MRARSSRSASSRTSRSACSTSTASCAASTCRRAKFFSALEKGFGFCDVVLGWDSNDQLYDNVTLHRLAHRLTRMRTVRAAAGDLPRRCPGRATSSSFLGEFAGAAEAVCPRGTLRRVLRARRAHGLRGVSPGFEYEFFVFERDAGLGAREALPQPQAHHARLLRLLVLRNSVRREFYRALLDSCERDATCRIEGLHDRDRPRRHRGGDARDCEALAAADKAALFKTFAKVLAQRHGLMATFMAKWSQRLAGPERPHSHLAARSRTASPCSTTQRSRTA